MASGLRRQGLAVTVATLLLVALSAAAPRAAGAPASRARKAGPWRWEDVGRIVAVGDVHGAYPELVQLLRESELLDEWSAWKGGSAHLVMLGDLEDRGDGGRKVLDLLMKLQTQARSAGGEVHVLLGNHEVMSLVGDTRYVTTGDWAAFTAEEPRGVRDAALAREKQLTARQGGRPEDAAKRFAEKCPPGFFGRRAAFGSRGPYGRWLLELPVAVVLNGTVFVHGGPGPGLIEAAQAASRDGHDALDALTDTAHRDLRSFLDAERDLQRAGIIQPEDSLGDALGLVAAFLTAVEADGSVRQPTLQPGTPPPPRPFGEVAGTGDETGAARAAREGRSPASVGARSAGAQEHLVDAARHYLALRDSLALREDGPLWYRPASDEAAEAPRLEAALTALGARRMVVGHTPTRDHRIDVSSGGRLLAIDTGMLPHVYGGRPSALILEGDAVSVRYAGEGLVHLGTRAGAGGPPDGTTPASPPGAAPSAPAEEVEEPESPLPSAPAPPPPARSDDSRTGAPAPAVVRPALPDARIEAFLQTAEVVKKEKLGTGITHPVRLTLRSGDAERRAIFKTIHEEIVGMVNAGGTVQMSHADKFVFEIAAYRLDRLIGLNMVPVTVPRTIDGVAGSVQDWVEDGVSEMRRKADGLEPADRSVLERQQDRMHLFDVLIYNIDRNATNVLVTPGDWTVHLIDHSRSFRLETRPPDALKGVAIPVPPDLAARLAALDLDALKSRLDGLLSREQMKAILKRRDWLLEHAKDAPGR